MNPLPHANLCARGTVAPLTRLSLFVLPRVAAGICHSGFSLPAVSAPFYEIRCRRLRTVGKKHGIWHIASVTLGGTEQQITRLIDSKVAGRALNFACELDSVLL